MRLEVDPDATAPDPSWPGRCRVVVRLSETPSALWLQAFFALAAIRADDRPWARLRQTEDGLAAEGVLPRSVDSVLDHLRVLAARASEEAAHGEAHLAEQARQRVAQEELERAALAATVGRLTPPRR